MAPPKKPKSELLNERPTVLVSALDREKIDAFVAAQGLTCSEVLRKIVMEPVNEWWNARQKAAIRSE